MIIINNMALPTSCWQCPCSYWTEGTYANTCQVFGVHTITDYRIDDYEQTRPEWCPLAEGPDIPDGRW